jgi:hypothetical protein
VQRLTASEERDPVVFVNAWNEWGEGAHLEPCDRWGHQYLEAHHAGMQGLLPSTAPAPPVMAAPAPEAPPVLSVVVVTAGDGAALQRCVDSVAATCRAAGTPQVVIVDNGSTDDTAEICSGLGAAARTVRNDERAGISRAWTQGLETVTGDYVLLLTPDIVLRPGWLEPMLRRLDRDGKVAALTPTIERTGNGRRTRATTAAPADGRGVCLLVRREALLTGDFRVAQVPGPAVQQVRRAGQGSAAAPSPVTA